MRADIGMKRYTKDADPVRSKLRRACALAAPTTLSGKRREKGRARGTPSLPKIKFGD